MKIVMICDFYDESLQYQESLIAKYYSKHGHTVSVITSTFDSVHDYILDKYDKKKPGSVYKADKVKIIRLPYSLNIMNKLRKFPGVSKILFEEKPDLIFIHDIHLNLREAAKYKDKFNPCKIIMDYHADYSNSAKNWISLNILHKIIRKSLFYMNIKSIDKIYPVVPAGFVFLNEVYGVPYNRMELLPLGSDTDLANSVMISKSGVPIRNKLGILVDDLAIFTGGKLTPAKKTDLLIEAFHKINNPNLHLIIVGDASKSDLEFKNQLLKLAGDNNKIHFVGWIDSKEVYNYMDACDLAVFPASQSVLWQQSISMGLPLIAGKVGIQDSSYLNLHGNVITLEEKDITSEMLQFQISRLINNRVLLDELKSAALLTSTELLSYDKIVTKTLEIVKENLSKHKSN
jgi:1,2-diacylglycerol 3-alpha-glucosyltransferase